MTIEEKLEKIKKLADDMYYAAANLGANVGSGERLRKTMEDYHKFIIHEYNKEEPVSEQNLSNVERIGKNWKEPVSEAAEDYSKSTLVGSPYIKKNAFKAGANWQKEQMMDKILSWLNNNVRDWIDMPYDQNAFIRQLENIMND